MRFGSAFTIIELLIVVAIIGILAAIGFVNLPRDRFAVTQAAEGLMRDYQLARFEAIRRNEFISLLVTPSTQEYVLFVEADRDGQLDVGEAVIKRVQVDELGGARITSTATSTILFDPRGITPGIAPNATQFNNQANDYPKRICVTRQGRARVVAATAC